MSMACVDLVSLTRNSYLSAEKRLNYLVNVDNDGLLRW